MNKQNQEYFKAKRKREQKIIPKSWLYVLPILLILLGIATWTTNKTEKIDEARIDEEIQNIGTRIANSKKTTKEAIIELKNLGLTVELHEGLKYGYSEHGNVLTAISQDTNELAYMIGEVPSNMQKSNMEELWIKDLKQEDPNIISRDSLGQIILETSQNGKYYKGLLKFVDINHHKIVLNSVTLKEKFKEFEPKMNMVFESIKTK